VTPSARDLVQAVDDRSPWDGRRGKANHTDIPASPQGVFDLAEQHALTHPAPGEQGDARSLQQQTFDLRDARGARDLHARRLSVPAVGVRRHAHPAVTLGRHVT